MLVAATACAFYLPALRRTHGLWPAPLDDVYIHFGFARSASLGRPFEWIPGNGYSSGGTSLLYPLVLAPGWILGLRGDRLGVFAALVACAALIDACFSIRRLLAGAPRWAAWSAPLLLLAVPLLDWSWFSGMETALLAAVLGRALCAVHRAVAAPALERPSRQLSAGLWCAALVATRPETAPLAALLAVSVAHGAGALSTWSSLGRALGPGAAFVGGQALVNRALTGEWSAAGAVRKALWTNPYATPLEVATEVVKNLAVLRAQALDLALGGRPWSWALPVLGLAAIVDRRTRRLAVPLLLGAWLGLLLVTLNATARFQNLRYAAPTLAMLVAAAALGVGALARRGLAARCFAGVLVAASLVGPARWFPIQIDHFSRASANIAEQQAVVAERIAALSPPARRVLVGDAGAIPYLSGLPAIDGLGLGGYHGLPFARASVHGVPAVVELLERLEPEERPDVMALYPGWWRGLADVFGARLAGVRIDDNVICAADEKVIYAANWSPLAGAHEARAGSVDALDVADLVDEGLHAYELPTPRGGWVVGTIRRGLDGGPRFDGGRIIPEGKRESFAARPDLGAGPVTLALRTDVEGPVTIEVSVERDGEAVGPAVPAELQRIAWPADPTTLGWREVAVAVPEVRGGDRISIRAARGTWRSFHVWLLRP